MIDFRPIDLNDKEKYNTYLHLDAPRGCEFSFTNLFMWGLQKSAYLHDHFVLYSELDGHCFYPFPIGVGDKKAVLDSIFTDARERGLCPCLTGLNEEARTLVEQLYPGSFYFHADRSGFDYVYDINDLADLKGRKLHRKRNHLKHFKKNHPNYTVTPISSTNLVNIRSFVTEWYKNKLEDNPDGDYHNEQAALEKAIKYYHELELEGLILEENGEILGFTIASQIYPDTYDVHYEKARGDIDGAYTTINSEFAAYIRSKHPHIKYLDREEDMGIPGLRKAKMSYFPHHLIKKYRAIPLNKEYTFSSPTAHIHPQLRLLWNEAFGDSDSFLDSFFSTAFDASRCRVATENSGRIASVLYWFDCILNDQRIAYIYAVATAKEYRGNGACHLLLEDTHKHFTKLGYSGIVLVPGNEPLVHLYEGCGYELCTKRNRIECTSEDIGIEILEIEKEEFSRVRREFLPKNSIIQENESLDFLATQAKFYTGQITTSSAETSSKNSFLLAGHIENETLYGIELLGDSSLAPGIVHALGCKDGTFFTPGKDEGFAMWHALIDGVIEPSYFGFAFD